jgi:hypothetical protein
LITAKKINKLAGNALRAIITPKPSSHCKLGGIDISLSIIPPKHTPPPTTKAANKANIPVSNNLIAIPLPKTVFYTF